MAFKRGIDRKQAVLFPESLDEYVAADSPVRLIDAFADNLDMIALGFHRVEPDDMGRPAYDPRVSLKVLIYGYFYGAGSSRRLEESGEGQMSLTDPDSKLMKENNGFGVGYNAQTAVDAGSHLIAGFVMTNRPTDHGLITEVAGEVKDDMGLETLEATADKGYHDPDDMASALENGVVPNVIRTTDLPWRMSSMNTRGRSRPKGSDSGRGRKT